MYLSTLDSLVGVLWWVLSESLRLPPWGFFFLLSCDEIRRRYFPALYGPFYGVCAVSGVL